MLHEVSFASFNERDQVQGWIYVPAAQPKGIIQIVHGFGEHSRRYFHMIVALMDEGYIVAANDHVGHGKTAMVNDAWADWGDKGCHTMMEDEHTFKQAVQEKYPDLPYFMYGHSMGSMIARDFAATYGDELAGLIICGTCAEFPVPAEATAAIDAAIAAGKGEEHDPAITGLMLGWMCERMGDVKLGNEWICHSELVQKDHAEDPFDAFTRPTSTRSLKDFAGMMECINGTEWAEKVPTDLPILNIAGDEDPVGNYGEGVYRVSNWLITTGHKVQTKLYPGFRHEIHNYDEIKCDVEFTISTFMDEALGIEPDCECGCC